jgi:hypothetical protein
MSRVFNPEERERRRVTETNRRVRQRGPARIPMTDDERVEQRRLQGRLFRLTPKGKLWALRHSLRQYNMTVEEYETMHTSQHGKCAICKEAETRKRGGVLFRLSVDHNHLTGKVRQLLCAACNAALGHLRESPILARRLAEYLEKHGVIK